MRTKGRELQGSIVSSGSPKWTLCCGGPLSSGCDEEGLRGGAGDTGHRKRRNPPRGQFQAPCHRRRPPLSLLGHSKMSPPRLGSGHFLPHPVGMAGPSAPRNFWPLASAVSIVGGQSPKKEGLGAPAAVGTQPPLGQERACGPRGRARPASHSRRTLVWGWGRGDGDVRHRPRRVDHGSGSRGGGSRRESTVCGDETPVGRGGDHGPMF